MGGIDGGNIVRHQVYGSNWVFKPHQKEKTNADRIRAMDDVELAEFLYQVGYDNGWGMPEFALEWLQMPAEEDKHEAD